jgi:hypothetical protein
MGIWGGGPWVGKLKSTHYYHHFEVLHSHGSSTAGPEDVTLASPSSGNRPFACCVFDDGTELPPYVWCLLLLEREGIMLQRMPSLNMTYRRVGFFELDGDQAAWEGDLDLVEII